jgi:hypothetical protein
MDVTLKRALAAAARAFADEIERDLPAEEGHAASPTPAGSRQSMLEVLRSVAEINDKHTRGANDDDMRAIARRAGIDPRGLAGYYSANLLEKRADGTRWLTAEGRGRLQRLVALGGVVILGPPDGP